MKTKPFSSGIKIGVAAAIMIIPTYAIAQQPANDVTTPLHLLQADYPTPYGAKSVQEIKATIRSWVI